MKNKNTTMKIESNIFTALTIAGSDSGGGAGIQADMLTFASCGVFATSAIAAITAQNPLGVRAISTIPIDVFKAQLETVYDYFKPKALKTGMLFDAQHIETTANFLEEHPDIMAVVDPVMISTSGSRLLKSDAEETLKNKLLPLATLITPNLDEAKALIGEDITNMEQTAIKLSKKFSTSVLLKGGHLDGSDIVDILCMKNGDIYKYYSTRIPNIDTHGSGCTLSASITAYLAKGNSVEQACRKGRNFLLKGMQSPVCICGTNFINHFPK